MEAFGTFPAALFLFALVGVVVMASWTDVSQRRIPNWLCALNLALGLGYAGLAYGGSGAGWSGVGLAALHAVAALVVTMILFALGAIGAGDAKFYTSMASWLPIMQGLSLLVAVALAGLVLLVVFFATRIRGRARRDPNERSNFDKLPYGVAIGLGGLAAVTLG
ncbi:A24 family peptidase [Tsuneonella sp. HG249]